MNANEKQTINLAAGQVLTITATSGVTGSVVRLPRLPGGGNAQSITAIAGASLTFGPYALTERFEVSCTAGSLTISTAAYNPLTPERFCLQEKTPVNAVAASKTLTSDNTEVADGATVTIGSIVYRFKDTPAAAYDVKRHGTTADTTMGNLIKAINATGTEGVEYFAGTAIHPTVSAGTLSSHAFTVTAKTAGVLGNSIAIAETSSHLSWAAAATLLSGGVDGTVGTVNETCADESYLYHCIAENTIADANWRRVSLGTAY